MRVALMAHDKPGALPVRTGKVILELPPRQVCELGIQLEL